MAEPIIWAQSLKFTLKEGVVHLEVASDGTVFRFAFSKAVARRAIKGAQNVLG